MTAHYIDSELEGIRSKWPVKPLDEEAYIHRWDEMGLTVGDDGVPVDEYYMGIISECLESGMDVLDIGCGSGDYCLELSGRANSVTGVDISPVLIDLCTRRAQKAGIGNVHFRKTDWLSDDLAGCPQPNGFDMVLAHYSPAVHCFDGFIKMVRSTRRFGLCCSELGWHNRIYKDVYRLAGMSMDDSCLNVSSMMNILWHLGLEPSIRYRKERTVMELDVGTATHVMVSYMSIFGDYDHRFDKDIAEYIESVSSRGKVEFKDEWTNAYVLWEVPDGGH